MDNIKTENQPINYHSYEGETILTDEQREEMPKRFKKRMED